MSVADPIFSLLLAYEDRLECGEVVTPEQHCADAPELLEEFRQRLDALRHFEAVRDDCDATEDEAFVVDAGARYRPEALHARGGLGEVHVAADVELGRRVALKRIRPAHARRDDARRRFLREAMITARLEHPGIVPVYGMVQDGRGRPCYAMRLIEGHSLMEAIHRLHGTAAVCEARPDLRSLLARFVSVCNAAAYAHSQGIVHRDLKPANIMLGSFGETLIVDWGLATACSSTDPAAPGPVVVAARPAGTSAGDGSWMETRGRWGAGTRGYSAPEQIDGRAPAAPAADIYSLGAILHAIICGTSRGDGQPLQARWPHRYIPRPLWAICRKAMAPEPSDRYRDAVDLAAEVERWLAGEAVAADSEPWTERAQRWARRNRVGVATAASALFVSLAIGGVLLRMQALEQAEWAVKAVTLTDEARLLMDRAEQQEAAARESLTTGDFSTSLATWQKAEDLLDQARRPSDLWPEAHDRRSRLEDVARLSAGLQAARIAGAATSEGKFDQERKIEGYQRALKAAGVDPLGQPEGAALARVRQLGVAEVTLAAIDDWFPAAEPATRDRLIAFAGLIDPDPERVRARGLSGEARRAAIVRRAGAATPRSEPRLAMQSLSSSLIESGELEAGRRLLKASLESHPDDFWFHHDLGLSYLNASDLQPKLASRCLETAVALNPKSAGAYSNLASAYFRSEDWQQAIAAAHRAIELDPDLAMGHHHLGLARQYAGDLPGAIEALGRAASIDADHPGIRSDLGSALSSTGQHERAIEECRSAVRSDPKSPAFRVNFGSVLRAAGLLEEAIVEYRAAMNLAPRSVLAHFQLGTAQQLLSRWSDAAETFRKLVRLAPENADAREQLAAVLLNMGDFDEAEGELRAAIRLNPTKATLHNNLGVVLCYTGELDDSLAHFREAARLKAISLAGVNPPIAPPEHAEPAAPRPGPDASRMDHSSVLSGNADVLLMLGHAEGAAALAREAIGICPDDPYAHTSLGGALADSGDAANSLASYRRAIDLPGGPPEAHWGLGLVLLRLGRFKEARESLARGWELGLNPAGGPTTSAEWVRCAESAIALADRLPGIVAGKVQPANPAEALAFARVCLGTGHYAAALRIYEEALRRAPALGDDRATLPRFHAATAALQLARGCDSSGPTPDSATCTRLRNQALAWLRADLDAWRRHLDGRQPDRLRSIRINLRAWKWSPDFASVRPRASAALPTAERQAWRLFWADVDTVIVSTIESARGGG